MAAIVTGAGFELGELHRKVTAELPPYARPLFLRIVAALELTGTFKQRTRELAREGYDPRTVSDELYLGDAARQEYQRLDVPLYQRLLAGQVRP